MRVPQGRHILAQHEVPRSGAECWGGLFKQSRAGFNQRHQNRELVNGVMGYLQR
jgi:hypothetical protein